MSQGAEATSPSDRTFPMQHGHRPASSSRVPATLVPEGGGWHVLHLFYRIDRAALAALSPEARRLGREQVIQALTLTEGGGVGQLHSFAIPGHKAEFGLMIAGSDLRAIHSVQTAIQGSALGPALVPAYSFTSLTEVSEYVPDVEQYAKVLRDREGMDPEAPAYQARVAQYEKRLGPMNQQRLTPDFPDWPCLCFYPMSKTRLEGQNWYLLPFETRSELMAQHGKSGMLFAGRVTQLITASTGLDDWEWGVTLWARNPSYLKEIVYSMRFDESSARYALFGPFYFGYILPAAEVLNAVRL